MRTHTLVFALLCVSACVVRVEPTPGDAHPDSVHATPGSAGDGALTRATDADATGAAACTTTVTETGTPIRLMTWNLEWFGDPQHGPSHDALQEDGAVDLLDRWHPDLVALQEVADANAFARVTNRLAGMRGVMAQAPATQKLALLHSATRFEVDAVEEIGGLDDAGRPPLHVTLHDRERDTALHVVVIHAKAGRDAADWTRRHTFAEGLQRVLAREPMGEALVLLGDFNDRIAEGSIVEGFASPYTLLLGDGAYATPTAALDASSTAWGAIIDHIVVTRALAPSIDDASVEVLREDALAHAPDFLDQVSDHFPVTLELAP